ncbi:hypothetical protein SKAU_G00040630 [Synaphobranchus kaupii]|uniref:Putative zinc-finger domain-containing protein n=1 Tax=Synaphobranchus kaupii TaxID=118154 RepID=A0A9Q1G1W9_SYNKA|nr:hypothetical protein SKAU_G00040630 [Synaphobranchus kaupii]
MELNSSGQSPREEEELEDGEICDDDTDEKVLLPWNRRPNVTTTSSASSTSARCARKAKPPARPLPSLLGAPPGQDFRAKMQFNRGPHLHPPFPPGHRQPGGPSGPDRPLSGQHCDTSPRSSFWERSHTALGRLRYRGKPHEGRGDWGRGGWGESGGGRGTGRPPPGRFAFGENHGNRKESPSRKQKLFGRNQVRKPMYNSAKTENGVDESFEDLLMKYKQIQLELECIRKEERIALDPKRESRPKETEGPGNVKADQVLETDSVQGEGALEAPTCPEKADQKPFQAFNLKPLRQKLLTPAERDAANLKTDKEPDKSPEGTPPPAPTATTHVEDEEEEEEETDLDISKISCVSSKEPGDPVVKRRGKDEDDELSELQLRLLALQSASKKWQQKEQQVMKESKEKITKAKPAPEKSDVGPKASAEKSGVGPKASAEKSGVGPKASADKSGVGPKASAEKSGVGPKSSAEKGGAGGKPAPEKVRLGFKAPQERGKSVAKTHPGKKNISPGSAAKQAWRKQQLRTWKLQHQKEQEEQRMQQEEEEERRKREDEIRKIRDLSNQDEQYNRFMKLVGAKRRSRSKSVDTEHRKSLGKQGLDTSGNLYQYDNYDEVAMDTDSEASSPASSPVRDALGIDAPLYIPQMHTFPTDSPPHSLALAQCYLEILPMGPLPGAPPPPLPPLPPDEPEQPPRPPFADEEEEEEMLLREELLKSLVSKRAVRPEDTSSNSAPPSPPISTAAPQAVPRGNLSALCQPRAPSTKFSRGHPPPRPPLVLPRHKSVVVRLNGSDDSDSEGDVPGPAPGPARLAFGGLESMIKEARRTAEAAKPRGSSASEKENNPIRTPEALPDAQKIEYRRLKEEIASREKQRVLRSDVSRRAAHDAEADAAGKAAAELQVTEAEDKLTKHKNLLLKDELLLKHLLQQEQRKRESLRAAEAKAAKLKEQLLASEKIAGANRLLLKKLEEQVHRVQHRVSVKKHQTLKLEKDLAQARAAAGRGGVKRRNDHAHFTPSKLQRLDGSPRISEQQFAELIAQKQRLQQLESEYALKIQMLKEAQALRHRGAPPAPAPSPAPFPLPQPSLHDLTQDKLTLPSEDGEAEDEVLSPASAATRGERRRSFRESGFFTKPKLRHPEVSPGKPAKPAARSPELLLGLNLEDLRQRYQESERLGQLMERGLLATGGAVGNRLPVKEIPVDVELLTVPATRGELRPAPFGPYHSPLLVFKSYRFSPYFRTKEKFSLSSVSYSNIIEPEKCFCRFDLTGTCNDDACSWQHMRNCTLNGKQLSQDILSYNLPLIGCSESSTEQEVSIATEKYISKLFGTNKDRMGTDQKAVLLVSKVNESRGHVPPHTTCKEARKWRPRPTRNPKPEAGRESSDEDAGDSLGQEKHDGCAKPLWRQSCALDVCVTQDDERYFTNETDDISNLETSVLESPRDVQLWIKLAYKYLNQKESSASECLDAALNTLARALEDNRDDAEVWCHYLTLFSRRGKREELQEMCEMAVEHAPSYQVWWKYLTVESSFDGKDYVCGRTLQYLLGAAGGACSELQSFHLLECLLYRAQLSLFSGRHQNALAILQNALKTSTEEKSMVEHLAVADRSLAWLSYIHLLEFGRLPASLFDPAQSRPSRVVSTDSFLLPWCSAQDVRTEPDTLVALFRDAVRQCADETLPPRERTLACLPLHTNMIALHQLLGRLVPAVDLCEEALASYPDCCPLLDALAELHLKKETPDKALNVWLSALLTTPHNAQILYHACKFLLSQEQSHTIAPLFKEFIFSFCEDEQSEQHPVFVLRCILGFPVGTLRAPPIRKELRDQLTAQMPYMCVLHCLWQSLYGSMGEAVDAFERALGTVMQRDVVQRLWLDYLLFTSSALAGSQCKRRDMNAFTDLVQRCLVTTASRLAVPFSSAQYWNCYSFHNKVISFYLGCLPQSQHSTALERLRYVMPNNTELALRLLQLEWLEGNIQHLKLQTRMLSSSIPGCLANWQIAIAVERELNGRSEVRQLYRQALQKLPLCAALWKDRLLFEAADGVLAPDGEHLGNRKGRDLKTNELLIVQYLGYLYLLASCTEERFRFLKVLF